MAEPTVNQSGRDDPQQLPRAVRRQRLATRTPSPPCSAEGNASASSKAARRSPARSPTPRKPSPGISGTELLSRAVKETISEADYAPANAVASVTLPVPTWPRTGAGAHPQPARRQDRQRRSHDEEQHHQSGLWRWHGGQVVRRPEGMVTDDGTGIVGGIDAARGRSGRTSSRPSPAPPACSIRPSRPAMNALWMKLIRGTEHPDLIVARRRNLRHLRERPAGEPALCRRQLGALGFETLKYKQRHWSSTAQPPASPLGASARLLLEHQVSEIRDLFGPQLRDARPARSVP